MTYKVYKNKFNHIIRAAKKKYYGEKFKESSSNIKETWATIKQLLNKENTLFEPPSHFVEAGKTITNPYKIACGFNDFFVNVGPTIEGKIPTPSGSPLDYIESLFFFF